MLEAGANCLPVALLFLGSAALVFALAPRASAGGHLRPVDVAFVWQLFGGCWARRNGCSTSRPFSTLASCRRSRSALSAAVVMLAIAARGGARGPVAIFRRRDLMGG